MNTQNSYQLRRQLMWGFLLIGVGSAYYLYRLDFLTWQDLWHYWPLAVIAFGVNNMIGSPTAKHFISGLWQVLMGLWWIPVFEGQYGLTFRNAWPMVIIIWGVMLILEPLLKPFFPLSQEPRHEK